MPSPSIAVGPIFNLLNWLRSLYRSRRKVKLTVHRAQVVSTPLVAYAGDDVVKVGSEVYCVTVTNASHDRDIVVSHIWLDTVPPIHIHDLDLPKRLKHSAPWETMVPASSIPTGTKGVEWLARCLLSPDDKVIKSRPRKNVPSFGTVPRG